VAKWEIRDFRGRLEHQNRLDLREIREIRVHRDQVEIRELLEMQVQRVNRDQVAHKDNKVPQVLMADQAQLVLPVQTDPAAVQASPANPDK